MKERWGAIEGEFAERFGILDLFPAFDGWPHGWRKFRTLLQFLSAHDSIVWASDEPVIPERIGERVAERSGPRRMSDEVWEALNRATGTRRKRGRVITLDEFMASGGPEG